jgi:peptidoglycan/xylan/chitin deacetylase (PgdA/CDA1 family)
LLVASALLHAAAAFGVLAAPAHWRSAGLLLLADHLCLAGVGMWPRSALLGPNLRWSPALARAGSVALTFDDGPEPEVTPRVLDHLATAEARATFFLIGARAERYPGLVRSIVDAGHALGNHTWSHRAAFAVLGPSRIASEIDRTQELLGSIAGAAPTWFRAPAGIRSPWLEPLLAHRGLRLVSWTRRGYDAIATNPERVLRRLGRGLRAGDILLLHDGQLTRSQRRRGLAGLPATALEVLPRLLERMRSRAIGSAVLDPPEPPGGRPPAVGD